VDRTRDKTTFIAGLLAIGFLVAGFVMWSHENARADHTMSVALLIAGGVEAHRTRRWRHRPPGVDRLARRGNFGQLIWLNELHISGSITTDEFVAAKTRLLRPDQI
jgi:hypothetical protein